MTAPAAPDDRGLPARRAALIALAAVDEHGAWSTTAVPDAVADLPAERDRRFASHLAYDTIRWTGTLDWMLDRVLTRPLADVEPALRRILRLGALQLWRMQVPARAAVDTSVALARRPPPRTGQRSRRVVNGVLRALARQLLTLPWPDPATDPVAHLALTTGHPAWVVEERLAVLGLEATRALLDADNDPPGLTLRATGDRDALLAELRDAGLDAMPTPHTPDGVRVPGADPRRLACVREGRAVPQDEASMLVVAAAACPPGARVLDLCAGPGGKTGALATRAGPTGHVTAVELHEHRAAQVREVAARIGVDVEVLVADGREVVLDQPVDVALVDAPCTGPGPDDASRGPLAAHAVGAARGRAPGGVGRPRGHAGAAGRTGDVRGLHLDHRRDHRRRRAGPGRARPGVAAGRPAAAPPDRDGTDGMFHATWVRAGAGAVPPGQ